MVQQRGGAPRALQARSSIFFTTLITSFSIFTDIFLYASLVPVLPFALHTRLHIPQSQIQHWVSITLSTYGVALLVSSPLAGWWADSCKTRRVPFLSGLVMLAGSTILFMLAPNIAVLLVARTLQGCSCGCVWTVASAILTDRVGYENVGTSMGWVMVARTVGIVAGPLLGGVLYARAGYFAVFGMIFATIGFDVVGRLILIEQKEAEKWNGKIATSESDLNRSKTMKGSKEAPRFHTQDSVEQGKTAITDRESKTEAPSQQAQSSEKAPKAYGNPHYVLHQLSIHRKNFITLHILTTPRPLTILYGCLLQATLLTTLDATLPLFVHYTFHWTSSSAGFIFLALVIPSFLAPLVGKYVDRYGSKWPSVIGYSGVCGSTVCLRLVQHNAIADKVLLAALLVMVGTFASCFQTPLWPEIMKCAEAFDGARLQRYLESQQEGKAIRRSKGQAYGLTNMVFALGLIVGPLFGGFVYYRSGWGVMTLSLGIVSGLGAIFNLLLTPRKVQ